MDILALALIYLAAAVIAAPLAQRLGLGSVLGYLFAGLAIGPALGVIGTEAETVLHFAEFGVVLMLFLVGLEVRPKNLWRMRVQLVGLGGAQMALTAGALAFGAGWLGLSWQSALAVGLTLALSSTAIALQSLNDRGLLRTHGGQSSFAVLLAQDVVFIPVLALLPLLADPSLAFDLGETVPEEGPIPGWARPILILAAVAAVVAVGRYIVNPAFRFIAKARLREIFTAAALLLVIAITVAMNAVGLSPALGAFIAGVVLSDSEYRHELESDIAPFKGLLLAVFFISVGAGLDLGLLVSEPLFILGVVAAVMVIKAAILVALGLAFRHQAADAALLGLGLAQAGEFAFVLISFGLTEGVFDVETASRLGFIVTASMLLSPALFLFFERSVAPRLARGSAEREADPIDQKGQAVIAGVGRFGQIVNRMLRAHGYETVVLDHDANVIDRLRRFGMPAWYGDATRPDLLQAAGMETAAVFVAGLDDPDRQTALVHFVRRAWPQITIVARAYDRRHLYELEDAGADVILRETFPAALEAGRAALEALGCMPARAEWMAAKFRTHDEETVGLLGAYWREEGLGERYVEISRARAAELEKVLREDAGHAGEAEGQGKEGDKDEERDTGAQ